MEIGFNSGKIQVRAAQWDVLHVFLNNWKLHL